MSYENFFGGKTSVTLFISFENCRNSAKEAMKVHVIDSRIMSVSNYRYPVTKSSNWTPT